MGRIGWGPADARIGYGNEGRTEQLAASLSDFIRLFSPRRPTSNLSSSPHHPKLSLPKTTQHTESLVVAAAAAPLQREGREEVAEAGGWRDGWRFFFFFGSGGGTCGLLFLRLFFFFSLSFAGRTAGSGVRRHLAPSVSPLHDLCGCPQLQRASPPPLPPPSSFSSLLP